MPDIRNFFGAKGGAPPKPVASKTDDTAKSSRAKRNVVADSDDEDQPPAKTTKAKAAPKKKTVEKEPHGVAISADDYFASSKNGKSSSTMTPTKASAKPTVKTEVPVRSSPRGKQAASAPQPRNGTTKRRSTTTPRAAATREDDDVYKEEGDEDDEDIFAADAKGRSKRKNDDYMDEDSEEEVLPQPKRIASRGRPSAASKAKMKEEEDEDEEEEDYKPQQKAAASKKRKTPEDDSEEEEEEKPRKKAAPSKPRAPRTKKTDGAEDPEYAKLLDSVTTVRAPTPPKEEEGKKFDWRQAKGGGNAAVQPQGAAEIPDGEDGCLTGLSFVFTGVLKTIGRDEGQELVKKYGGKVTGQPSGKTDFVVLGDDAGPSKLKKIKEAGIKTIDENGLFELIKKLPAFGGGGKGAAKAMEKKQAELDKVKQQAQEMEAEEKARQAEAARLAKKAAAARGTTATAAPPPTPPSAQLLTSKYAPTSLTHICGNKGNVEKIQNWLRGWPKAKKYDFKKRGADGLGGERAIIISGPPGIGKTTAAHLAARLEGYDVLESNASDTRSKKLVEAGVSDVMNNTSLLGYFAGDGRKVDAAKKKIVLVMDEVDGMSGGDRGGVGALAKFCKKTEVPLILICNERKLPKMKPFDHVAFDIKFQRPTVDQIRSRIMTICHREGLRLPPNVVDALIEGSNKDIRQIINMISTAKLDQSSMDYGQSKAMSKAWEKHVVLKPWDICQKMLAGGLFAPASKATLNDKIELYFNDHEFSFLMIQENYLRTKPMALTNKGYSQREERLKALELFDQAAESISDGDLVDRMIHGPQQHWSLMPTHAVFSTVRPSSFVAGQLMGSNFTSWLGNFSKSGKLGRLNREVHAHMRLRTSGDHNEIRQEYLPVLWERTVNKLQHEGTDAVPDVIELMDSYYLTREDFDSIQELGVGRMSEDIVKIETATKSAFTRKYNAASHPVPFMKASSIAAPVKAAAKEAPDLEEAIEEEDDAQAAEPAEAADEDEIDLKKDKYIKQPKKKPAAKKATAKAGAGKDGDVSPQKARGRPKAAASKAKAKK